MQVITVIHPLIATLTRPSKLNSLKPITSSDLVFTASLSLTSLFATHPLIFNFQIAIVSFKASQLTTNTFRFLLLMAVLNLFILFTI